MNLNLFYAYKETDEGKNIIEVSGSCDGISDA